jgi:hypothetical protein
MHLEAKCISGSHQLPALRCELLAASIVMKNKNGK